MEAAIGPNIPIASILNFSAAGKLGINSLFDFSFIASKFFLAYRAG